MNHRHWTTQSSHTFYGSQGPDKARPVAPELNVRADWTKQMIGVSLQSWPVVRSLLFVAALSGSTGADAAEGIDRNQRRFIVAGVTLGMDFESVLSIYPTATVERAVPNCYNYGRAISVPAYTRRTLRHQYKAAELTLSFEPPGASGGVTRIQYDRPVEQLDGAIQQLLDRLSVRYGPYDRILHRRKMEPAGRIVGFEWHKADGATLRVVLRNEYGNGNDGIRLNILARSKVSVSRPTGRALSLSCGKP